MSCLIMTKKKPYKIIVTFTEDENCDMGMDYIVETENGTMPTPQPFYQLLMMTALDYVNQYHHEAVGRAEQTAQKWQLKYYNLQKSIETEKKDR